MTPVESSVRGRFAPAPTGRLHFGSLVAAVGSWLDARHAGGAWIVRMEDLDREREVPGAGSALLATLAAFGLESDEAVVYQSRRGDAYRDALDTLVAQGVAYPCRCSRRDLEGRAGIHPARCIGASESARAPSWRVRVPEQAVGFDDRVLGAHGQNLQEEAGDFVVWRVEGTAAYQLAVVVDDAAQSISHVVRGADLLDSTPRQIWLQQLLGLPQPRYAHLPLALGVDGRKLSKQDSAVAVDAADPMPALRAALSFLGQRECRARTPHTLLAEAHVDFCIAAIPRASARPGFAALQKDV